MKQALFIDRDGTIIREPEIDFQVDSLEKLEFFPYAISSLARICSLDFEMVMVSNQDGRGTDSFPEEDFLVPQNKMLSTLKGEGVLFDEIFIDDSFEEQNSPNRKPRTGMLTKYLGGEYLLEKSYVIGDRATDVELAKNLGAKAILFRTSDEGESIFESRPELRDYCALITNDWRVIYEFLRFGSRTAAVHRVTNETDIELFLDLDGGGKSSVDSSFRFLDHMLEQIVHHAGFTLNLKASGDTDIDEHHTIEDIGIVLGEAVKSALGDKRGIERYGFSLPMDECDATTVIDFGGRIDFSWDVEFKRDGVGDIATEMFEHFFKSFAHSATANLHIRAAGDNDHHKIEGIFKSFARALKGAVRRDPFNYSLPTSKGLL